VCTLHVHITMTIMLTLPSEHANLHCFADSAFTLQQVALQDIVHNSTVQASPDLQSVQVTLQAILPQAE